MTIGVHCGSEFVEMMEADNAPERFEPYVVKASQSQVPRTRQEEVPQTFFIEQTISSKGVTISFTQQ